MFRPVKPMLAQMATTVAEALQEHGGQTALEYKLDGARIQIHKSKNEVKVFSRRLTDVTESLPEVVDLVRREVKAEKAVLEGEVIAVDREGKPLPFQHLMRRFRRVREIVSTAKKVQIQLHLFDTIHVDGKTLIDRPYTQRRKKLERVAGEIQLDIEGQWVVYADWLGGASQGISTTSRAFTITVEPRPSIISLFIRLLPVIIIVVGVLGAFAFLALGGLRRGKI